MKGPREDHAVARSGRRTVRERVGRERRVLRAGLLVSVLLHLVAVGVIGGLLERRPEPPPPPAPLLAEPPSGMRAVRITVSPSAPTTQPVVEPRRPEDEAREEVELRVPDIAVAAPADDRTAADRLAPRLVDPRLWRPVVLIPRDATLADVQARVDAALELLSDSALADAEARVRATDWTVRDGEGGRWGISPGKLHLGKLTLPLPLYYTEEWDPERGEWYDLEAQVDRALILESFEDRVRAIRERRDRERRERREKEEGGAVAGSGSGG